MVSRKNKALEKIHLAKLSYTFQHSPLLVGGLAMMYYGLRDSTKDIDLIVSMVDHKCLVEKYSNDAVILEKNNEVGYKSRPHFVDLFGDHGILIYDFEIWDNIMQYGYSDLKEGAIKEKDIFIISPEKLLLLSCVRGAYKKRYLDDAALVGKYLSEKKYKGYKHKPNEYWRQFS